MRTPLISNHYLNGLFLFEPISRTLQTSLQLTLTKGILGLSKVMRALRTGIAGWTTT